MPEGIFINIIKRYTIYMLKHSYQPVRDISILTLLPVLLYGCVYPAAPDTSAGTETTINLDAVGKATDRYHTIDILSFNDDKLQRLDSYQRMTRTDITKIKAGSSSGDKIFEIIMNSQKDCFDWAEINSRSGLKNINVNLEQETEELYVMTGTHQGPAGEACSIGMMRLSSEITLRSINCDFSGKAYSGKTIAEAKVYLTNVNAECPIWHEGPYRPIRIVNSGKLNMSDVSGFQDPESIVRDIGKDIGINIIKPGITLRCYPNEVEKEGPGTPFTKIVIEGKVDDETYYWPININRNGNGTGVSRNSRYIYDIRIRRLGSKDPDFAIEPEDADIKLEIEEWEEKEEYGVRF